MSAQDFETIQRPTGEVLAHKTLPIWVCYYPLAVRGAFYQGYIATGKLIKGQHPCIGGVDNRRVGHEDGFRTVEEACAAAVAKAQGGAA